MSQKSQKYCVYVLEFPFIEGGREAYVGLSRVGADKRYKSHMLDNLAIKENMENGEESVGKILEDGLTNAEAVLKETEWLAFYHRTGWDMLNIKVAGSTGAPEGGAYWTLETCKADALKYNTKIEWIKKPKSGYATAQQKGWLEECCAHMIVFQWTLEACKAEALKYETKNKWRSTGGGYSAAHKNGWLKECGAHMRDGRLDHIIWTRETCRTDALKYNTKVEWIATPKSGYHTAQRNGWLKECCAHMRDGRLDHIIWTRETCKADALEYGRKKEWKAAPKSGYQAARKNDWIEECCAHMRDGNLAKIKWTLETCKADALKYNTRYDWSKTPKSGYHTAQKNGWLEECCAHMRDGIKWTLEACKADALKYSTKSDWCKAPKNGYSSAQKNGWLEECCRHMDIHKQITSKGTYSLSVLPRCTLALGMYEGACYSTPLRDDGEPDFASWKKFDDFENTELCEYIRKNCEVTDEDQFYYLSKALPNAL